jgi:uroporphyrinogen decarboxylase
MSDKIIKDFMTPKERMTAYISGKSYDRMPCIPSLGDHAATVIGVTVGEYHRSAELMAKGQIAAYRKYGHDGVGVGPGSTGIAEAVGSKVAFPDRSTPFVSEHVIKEKPDLKKLEIPDGRKSGRFNIFLEALEIILDEIGDEITPSLTIGGPVSTAANMRGTEKFMKDLYIDPEFAHGLLDFAVQITIPLIKEAGKLGVKFGIVDPVSSGSLISPKIYKEFAFPYQKAIIDEMRKVSTPPSLHICGNTTKNWQLMSETGAGSLSLDNVIDIEDAKKEVGEKIGISGNVNPTESMYLGNREIIEKDVKQCLRKAYDSPKGFILAMGCGLPIFTPHENVHALMDAVRKFGRYPLDPNLFG